MFISKEEKLNLIETVERLTQKLFDLEDAHYKLLQAHKKMSTKVDEFLVSQIAQANREKAGITPSAELEIAKHEKKKASMREYYHRKKAERLEREAKEKAAQARATLNLQTETSQ